MEKEFIPYEQALALKELGFDEPCMKGYTEEYKKLISFSNTHTNTSVEKTLPTKPLTAPLYQQAFRWFREKYGYFQLFDYQHGDSKKNTGYFFNIVNIKDSDFFFPEDFKVEIYKTYEEAELECLKKLIEIVKDGK